MTGLTPRQAEVLRWIVRYAEEHGVPPSRGDLASAMGFSRGRAEQQLRKLQRKGYLRIDPGIRAMRVLRPPPSPEPPSHWPPVRTIEGQLCVLVWGSP